jgi:hypothetical protein
MIPWHHGPKVDLWILHPQNPDMRWMHMAINLLSNPRGQVIVDARGRISAAKSKIKEGNKNKSSSQVH